MNAVREYGLPLVDDPQRLDDVRRLGVDEKAFLAANAYHWTSFITGVVDLTGRVARLLDVVDGRSGKALCDWVSERSTAWRDAVTVAALDPFRGYATALSTSLPGAVRVLDAFHVTRLGFAAVDEVRRRVQQDSTGHRGRKHDPLYRIRRLLRRRADRLSELAWRRLLIGLDLADVDEQIGRTWIAAQDLCRLYHCRSRYAAEHHLYRWLMHCAETNIPELHRLARTLDTWRTELLAYFDTGGLSNGPTEAVNALIKKIKRIGHGYRNFTNYRLRLLLHCGVNCKLHSQHESEAGYHDWPRKAVKPQAHHSAGLCHRDLRKRLLQRQHGWQAGVGGLTAH